MNDDALDSLRILRVLRVLRLIKLARLLKASRLLKRWETSIALDFSTQSILSSIASYLLAGHWFACFMVLITSKLLWLGFRGSGARATPGPNVFP